MPLTGDQTRTIHDALANAFRTKASLTKLVRFNLNEQLEHIADGQNTSDIIFNLIDWADAQGRIKELLQAAIKENPQNEMLRQCLEDLHLEINPWIGTGFEQPINDDYNVNPITEEPHKDTYETSEPKKLPTVEPVDDPSAPTEIKKEPARDASRNPFNWISQNKEWVFSGVGVAVVTLFSPFLIKALTSIVENRRSLEEIAVLEEIAASEDIEEQAPFTSPPITAFSHNSFLFEFQRCREVNSYNGIFACNLTVINTAPEERNLTVYNYLAEDKSRVFEFYGGNVFDTDSMKLGNAYSNDEKEATLKLPSGIPVATQLDFNSNSSIPKYLSLLEIVARDDTGEVFKIKFRNVEVDPLS